MRRMLALYQNEWRNGWWGDYQNMIGPKYFYQLCLSIICQEVVIGQNLFHQLWLVKTSLGICDWSSKPLLQIIIGQILISSSAVKRDTQIVHDSRINENNGYQLSRSPWNEKFWDLEKEKTALLTWWCECDICDVRPWSVAYEVD